MTTPMTGHERMQMVRYTRPERWPLLDRFAISTELSAQILSEVLVESAEGVHQRVHDMGVQAAAAAADLLTDFDYREALRRLPFSATDRVAALGDSLTSDRLGWFELLTHTMQLSGSPAVATHNLGLSGNTTADAIERFDLLEAFRPTHVLVMLGTNDARRHGRRDVDHRMVSRSETRRNLTVLQDLITRALGARAIFLTPPPADQKRITAEFAGSSVRWRATELADIANLVRKIAPDHIDIHAVLKKHDIAEYLDADGVHLSPAGQRLVAAAVVRSLARPALRDAAPGPAPVEAARR